MRQQNRFTPGALVGSTGFRFRLAAATLSATFDCVDDPIHIEQLEVFAHIGVPDDERSAPQRLTFSITLWPVRDASQLDDQITRAVNYAAVCAEVRKFVGERRDKLIETLADQLAFHLLQMFGIRRITIELRKYILPDVEFVSVTVTRERAKE
jgi:7,8-dihydroneopterin aldolase/epimerase/oxygenase